MVYHTAGAVFSAFSYLDAFGVGAENKALNFSEILNKEGGIGNEEGGRECSMFNDQCSIVNGGEGIWHRW